MDAYLTALADVSPPTDEEAYREDRLAEYPGEVTETLGKTAKGLLALLDDIDADRQTAERLGTSEPHGLYELRSMLETLGALLSKSNCHTLKDAACAFQDAEGDFNRVLSQS